MNRSTLLKLGALGATLYLANKNKNAQANAKNSPVAKTNDTEDKNTSSSKKDKDDSKHLSPFTYGKQLAKQLLGKKF